MKPLQTYACIKQHPPRRILWISTTISRSRWSIEKNAQIKFQSKVRHKQFNWVWLVKQINNKDDTIADLRQALEDLRIEAQKKDQRIADFDDNVTSLTGIIDEMNLTIEEQKYAANVATRQLSNEVQESRDALSRHEVESGRLVAEVAQGNHATSEFTAHAEQTARQQDQLIVKNTEEVSALTAEL